MAQMSHVRSVLPPAHALGAVLRRGLVIGAIAFFTLVDLFATQAILPSLTVAYQASPSAMGVAVNASTLGMAVASLLVALLSRCVDRRNGILVSLVLLAVPTALLANAPDLATFAVLRIAQGCCMASAFTLMLAHLGERCSATEARGAFAAYITGNVASNLIGRFISAAVADNFGIAWNFYFFALLNLAGAALVFATVDRTSMAGHGVAKMEQLRTLLRADGLCAAFAIGFCILFAFIGTFTYVNFVLVRPPLSLGMMQVGFVYLVFLPSIATTLAAGAVAARIGSRPALWTGLVVAGGGLPLLLLPTLSGVLTGMVLVAIGTFFAQAVATGFVGRAARINRGAASGVYLASYFLGGIAGSAVLGQLFDRFGWSACVLGIAAAIATAALLAVGLEDRGGRRQ